MLHKFLTIVFITLFISACGNNNKKNATLTNKKIVVDLKHQKRVKLSELCGNIQTIPTNIIVGEVTILKKLNNRIYILDEKEKQVVCYCLEKKEKIFIIDSYGKGPGEFIHLTNFLINEYIGYLEILDGQSRKILRFDLNDGNFVSEHTVPFAGHYIEALDSSQYVVFTNYVPDNALEDNCILITDENYQVIQKHIPFDKRLFGLSIQSPVRMVQKDDHWLLSQPFSYDIYTISRENVNHAYTLNFPGYELNEHMFDILKTSGSPYDKMMSQKKFLDNLVDHNVCCFIENFYESENIIGFRFSYQKQKYLYLHSKKRNRDLIIEKILLDDGTEFEGEIHRFYNDVLITSFDDETAGLKIMMIDLKDF